MDQALLDILACPACRTPVRPEGSPPGECLACDTCGRRYPVRDGIPVMLLDEAARPVPPAGR